MKSTKRKLALAVMTTAAIASAPFISTDSSDDDEGTKNDHLDLAKVKGLLKSGHDDLMKAVKDATDEIKENYGELSENTKGKLDSMAEKCTTLTDQIQQLEQKLTSFKPDDRDAPKSLGQMFVETDEGKQLLDGAKEARMNIKGRLHDHLQKAAIINATGQNQPLVPADRTTGVIHAPERILEIRNMLPRATTSSNLIEFPKENVFTNNAGPQVGGSPEAFENVTKPESGITFTLANEAVQTLAHWIPVSKQVLADSPMLQGYINMRLMYGLKLEEEDQLLNGSGSNGNLNGLLTQATAWANESPNITNEIDVIRSAIKQAHLSEYRPDGIVLNPQDWFDIDTKKVGTADDRYVVGNPRAMGAPMLWGLPVAITNSIASGTFLVGAFQIGAMIWDREQAAIEVSRENSDNFVKNMATILCEERIALTVFRPAGFIKGSL